MPAAAAACRPDAAVARPIDEPLPAMAICGGCDTTVLLAAGQLPPGWDEVADPAVPGSKSARCGDCRDASPAGERASPTRCRVSHWLVGGRAVVRIHAGAGRPSGRDDPLHFLANVSDLDELIADLGKIRTLLTEARQ